MNVPLGRGDSGRGFFGRDHEAASLLERIVAATNAKGSSTIVIGPAGIGKSRLLDFVVREAERARAIAIVAQNYAHVRSSFGPITDILIALSDRIPDLAPTLPSDLVAYNRLLGADESALGAHIDKRRLFVIVADALHRAAKHAPLVLVFDDMHWSDPESVELIAYLTPRISNHPIAVILATRPPDLDAESAALDALYRLPVTVSIELAPVTPKAARLIARSVGDSFERRTLDRICELSDGNPFFIEELARAALRSSDVPLTQTLRATTLKHVRSLEDADRELLEIASALGRDFTLTALAVAASQSEAAVVAALRRARLLGIVEESDSGLRFRHELLRVALYDGMFEIERQAIHRRLALRFEDEAAPPEILAYHWAGAGEMNRAAVYFERAGDAAMAVNASATARDAYVRALDCRTDDDIERAKLEEKTAIAFDRCGESIAAEYYERALAAAKRDGREIDSIRLLLALAPTLLRAGKFMEAVAILENLIEHPLLSPTQRFTTHVLLAIQRTESPHFGSPEKDFAAADAGLEHGTPDQRCQLERVKAFRAIFANDDDAWLPLIRRAVEITNEPGVTPYVRATTHQVFELMARERGRHAIARGSIDEAVSISEENGLGFNASYARSILLELAYDEGRLDDAFHILEAIDAMHVTFHVVRAQVAIVASPLLLELGREDLLGQYDLHTFLEIARKARDHERIAELSGSAALEAWTLGRTLEAESIVGESIGQLQRPQYVAKNLEMMCRAGSLDQATHIETICDRGPNDGLCGLFGNLVRANVASRCGDTKKLTRSAERARQFASEYGFVLAEARALEYLGRTSEAAALYARSGASRSLQRIGPKRPGLLTSREREVASLVRLGLSNRTIAGKLSVSERTVEHHVTAIFAKSGVRSRSEFVRDVIEVR